MSDAYKDAKKRITKQTSDFKDKEVLGMLSNKPIDEILEGVIDWAESGRTTLGRPPTTLTPQEAKTALYERLLEVIGADEHSEFGADDDTDYCHYRNELRAAQRKALAELMGIKE